MAEDLAPVPDWVIETQNSLGTLITKPRLSDKYLTKPPFRFLLDIVMEVLRITNFGKSVFTQDECDSSKVAVRHKRCFSCLSAAFRTNT